MATLGNKRNLAAVSRKTSENTRNSQSQNRLDPGVAQKYISQVSEEIEGRATKNFTKEFSRIESRILGSLLNLDEFLPNPQVRICSVAVPGTSGNGNSENREPTGDRSLGDPYPEAVFSACHSSSLNDAEQDETHHSKFFNKWQKHSILLFLSISERQFKPVTKLSKIFELKDTNFKNDLHKCDLNANICWCITQVYYIVKFWLCKISSEKF